MFLWYIALRKRRFIYGTDSCFICFFFTGACSSITSLTHWGRVTHICVSKLTIIASGNGLSPGRRQAIIWNNAGILSTGTLGTNFSEILSESHAFLFKKMHLKTSSAKRRPFCLGLNVLSNLLVYQAMSSTSSKISLTWKWAADTTLQKLTSTKFL